MIKFFIAIECIATVVFAFIACSYAKNAYDYKKAGIRRLFIRNLISAIICFLAFVFYASIVIAYFWTIYT